MTSLQILRAPGSTASLLSILQQGALKIETLCFDASISDEQGQSLALPSGKPCDADAFSGHSAGKRMFHSSSVAAYERYARVLRKPMDKAKVYTRKNYEEWTQSGMDIGMAQQMLADLKTPSQLARSGAASRLLLEVIRDARSVADLQLAVQELQPYLSTDVVVAVCVKAVSFLNQDIIASTGSDPLVIKHQVTQLMHSLVPKLTNMTSELTTDEQSQLLYALARGRTDTPDLEDEIAKELTAMDAYRLSVASCTVVASMLRSSASLRWQRSIKHGWSCLLAAAAKQLPKMDEKDVMHVTAAMYAARETNEQVWSGLAWKLRAFARSGNAQTAPQSMSASTAANILFTAAKVSQAHQSSDGTKSVDIVQLLDQRSEGSLIKCFEQLGAATKGQMLRGAGLSRAVYAASACPEYAGSAIGQLLQGCTFQILSLSITDVATLLHALAALKQQHHVDRSLSQQVATLTRLAAGVAQSQALQSAASVDASMKLLETLPGLRTAQDMEKTLQGLQERALKLMPALSPPQAASLITTWSKFASTTDKLDLLTAGTARMSQLCDMSLSTRSADSSRPTYIPVVLLNPAVQTLTEACTTLSHVADGNLAAATKVGNLRTHVMALSDLLGRDDTGVQNSVSKANKARAAESFKQAGLQDSKLYQLLVQ